jgi:PEP-CTERM motif
MNPAHFAIASRALAVSSLAIVVCAALTTSAAVAAEQTRSYLYDKFQDGDIPTGQDFADMIDSALHFMDSGFSVIGTAAASDGRALLLEVGATVDASLTYAEVAGLSNAWAGHSGFMAIVFADGPASHYGYFQLSSGEPGGSALYPMHFQSFTWQDQAGAPLVTSSVPEPGSFALLAVAAGVAWCWRRWKR